jgi:hypothetical protein
MDSITAIGSNGSSDGRMSFEAMRQKVSAELADKAAARMNADDKAATVKTEKAAAEAQQRAVAPENRYRLDVTV